MSEHHHHHHHHRDGASKFKQQSLRAIKMRKVLEKTAKIALVVVAFLMAIALMLSYVYL